MARKVKERAEARGMTAVQFSLLWILNNRQVCSVVCGARTVPQLEGYLTALDHGCTAEDEEFVDSLVAPGHPWTPGFTDPHIR